MNALRITIDELQIWTGTSRRQIGTQSITGTWWPNE